MATEESAVTDEGSSEQRPRQEHRCFVCNRTYERVDHLNRHLKSHDNERAYKCSDCGKGFNRADLLNRHRSSHENAAQGERSVRRRTEKACQACIKSKTKCDEDRPCKVSLSCLMCRMHASTYFGGCVSVCNSTRKRSRSRVSHRNSLHLSVASLPYSLCMIK